AATPLPPVAPPLPAIPMVTGIGVKLLVAGALVSAVGIGASTIASAPTAAASSGPGAAVVAPKTRETAGPLDHASQVAPSHDAVKAKATGPIGPPAEPQRAPDEAQSGSARVRVTGRAPPPAPRADDAPAPQTQGAAPSRANSLAEETALLREAQTALT